MARSMRRLLFGSAVMLAALSARAGWLNGWEFRRAITVDSSQIGADLVDFPVMVRLTTALIDMGVARPDGFDIRFTSSDGVTLLDFEREMHDAARDRGLYWVRLPLVSSSS
ncbi:MAG: hypothetical protein GX590_00265, partial [Lentisphaerae bacterium]|nr:hypothetical protein [Lentisphaerota bacterium]